jgi:hypothetical protein
MKTILVCFALLVAAGSLPAAEDPPSAKLSQFKVGAQLAGPKITLADATGKAVLIYACGVSTGEWLASLTNVERISKRYKDKMLVFGANSQDGTDGEILEVVKKYKLTFTITKGVTSPIVFSKIPHAFVFDTTGVLIFSGKETDAEYERSLRKATQGAGGPAAAKPSGLDALKRPGP